MTPRWRSNGSESVEGHWAMAAKGFARVEVRDTVIGSAVLTIVAIGLFFRRLRRSRLGFGVLLVSLAGLVVGIFGTVNMGSVMQPMQSSAYWTCDDSDH